MQEGPFLHPWVVGLTRNYMTAPDTGRPNLSSEPCNAWEVLKPGSMNHQPRGVRGLASQVKLPGDQLHARPMRGLC